MKIKQLFLGSAVALMALTACNKNGANTSVPTPEVGATAGVLRIEIASANGGLRAATVDGPNANPTGTGIAGTTGEQGVTDVSTYVFSHSGAFVDSKDYTKGSQTLANAGTISEADAAGKFLVDGAATLVLPFKTTAEPGVDNVLFVVVNKPSFFPTAFTNISEFTDAVNHALAIQKDQKYADGIAEMTADSKFMMVGECPNFNLTKNLTYDDVKGDFSATNNNKNQFLLTVNRVVSKLVVDFSENPVGKAFGDKGEAAGKLLGFSAEGGVETNGVLYYTVANSNKSMVIYNNPNVNTVGSLAGVKDENYKTPNMDTTSDKTKLDEISSDFGQYFYRISEDKIGNKVGASPAKPFTPIAVATVDSKYATGKYFMEADNTGANWLWDNTPMAKIYACVLPSKVYILTDKNANTANGKIKGNIKAVVIANLDALKATKDADKGTPVTEDGSFFMGTDGRYYASQAAANVGAGKTFDESTDPAKTKLYTKGRCVYRFPVNANDYDYTNFKNAYNKRNHIYALTVAGIAAIGDNYDPTDPNDPNVPQPENPNEPENKGKQPIAKSTIYAAVKATMANWTVVKNSVTLGK